MSENRNDVCGFTTSYVYESKISHTIRYTLRKPGQIDLYATKRANRWI